MIIEIDKEEETITIENTNTDLNLKTDYKIDSKTDQEISKKIEATLF
jgi:hypothetical protein